MRQQEGKEMNSARMVASAASSSDVGQPRGDRERPRGSPRIGENGRAAITLRASGSPAYWRMRSSLRRSFTVDQVTNLPTPGRQLASRIDRWKNVDFPRMRNPFGAFRRFSRSSRKAARQSHTASREGAKCCIRNGA